MFRLLPISLRVARPSRVPRAPNTPCLPVRRLTITNRPQISRAFSTCPPHHEPRPDGYEPHNNKPWHRIEKPEKLEISRSNKSTAEVVQKNRGLTRFIRKTYNTTALGIAGTLATAQGLAVYAPDLVMESTTSLLLGGFVTAIGGCFALDWCKYDVKKRAGEWISENTTGRKLAYGAIIGGMTATMTPMVTMVNEISPMILPSATLTSLAVMGGASLYAYRCKDGELLKYQGPLMGGLFGLVGVGLMGLGSLVFLGPDSLMFQMLHSVDLYGGIVLFTALTAYDTHKAVEHYQKKDPDHLGCSIELYLDFVNLLIRISEIMAKFQKK